MNKELLQQLNQRPIAYYPVYRALTGSTTAGILLSQLMYWFTKKDKIFKTDEEIMTETLLTEKELRNAKAKIKNIDFITITREGVPATTYYKIDWEKYAVCLSDWAELDSPKGRNCTSPKGETIIVKSLTETTTENKNINTKRKSSYPQDDTNLKAYAIQKAAQENIHCPISTYESFKDHHISNGTKFNDWERAFSTWVRNFFKFKSQNHHEVLKLTDADNLTGTFNYNMDLFKQELSGKLFIIKKEIFIQKVLDGKIIVSGIVHA